MSPEPKLTGRAEYRSRLAFAWRMARGDRMAWFIGLVIALVFMGAISPLLCAPGAIAAPLTALLSHLMGLRGRRVADAYRTRYGGYSSWLFEIIRGAADLAISANPLRGELQGCQGTVIVIAHQCFNGLSCNRRRVLGSTVTQCFRALPR